MQSNDILGNQNYIYLYTAGGANPVCVEHTQKSLNEYLGNRYAQLIKIDDPSYFRTPEKLVNAAAVVFPGGSAMSMAGTLGQLGKEGVKRLIKEKGVSYIGFCAGAYLVNDTYYDYKGEKQYFHFTIKAINTMNALYGPAYPLDDIPSPATAKIVPIRLPGESELFYCYWNGGGYYESCDHICEETMAYYDSNVYEEKIAVMKFYGRSTSIISNIHPEMRLSLEELKQRREISQEDAKKYLDSLPKQVELFDSIFRSAGIKKSEPHIVEEFCY